MPASTRHLTREETAFFDREGYLVVPDLLSDADLQPAMDEIAAEIDQRARSLMAEGKLSRLYDEYGFEARLAKIHAESDRITKGILSGQLSGPAFFGLIACPRILDVIESLCGPELVASGAYRLRPKIPGWDFGKVPWHQDSGYFEPTCDGALIVTMWIPFVDATPENGCMWVIPRMQTGNVLKHIGKTSYLEIPEADLPVARKVCVPVQKGGVLLLSNRTPHASFENRTERIRWSMDLRYQSATLPTNARITRLPGEHVPAEGAKYTGACYPPEPEFLVRSRQRPREVLRSAEEFHRLRKEHQGPPVTKRWNPETALPVHGNAS